jgi:hypothetical protein
MSSEPIKNNIFLFRLLTLPGEPNVAHYKASHTEVSRPAGRSGDRPSVAREYLPALGLEAPFGTMDAAFVGAADDDRRVDIRKGLWSLRTAVPLAKKLCPRGQNLPCDKVNRNFQSRTEGNAVNGA